MKLKPIVVVSGSVASEGLFRRLESEGYLPIMGRPDHVEVKGPVLEAEAGFWERLFYSLWQWRRAQRRAIVKS